MRQKTVLQTTTTLVTAPIVTTQNIAASKTNIVTTASCTLQIV